MPGRFRVLLETVDRPLLFAGGFIVCILAVGTIYTETTQGNALLLSPTYLLLHQRIGSNPFCLLRRIRDRSIQAA